MKYLNPGGIAVPNPRLPAWLVVTAALLMTGALGLIDYYVVPTTGPLYLTPVAMAAWLAGGRAGVLVAIAASLTSLAGELPIVESGAITSSLAAWNAVANLLVWAPAALILDLLHDELLRAQTTALTDHLTGAGNARAFTEAAEAEIRRAGRYGRPLSMAYIDVDNFKAVNDHFGHSGGDEVLRLIATTLRAHLRLTDCVARLGGDEFGLLLPETDAAQAHRAVDNVRAALGAAMAGHGFDVTFSIGVMTFMSPPASVDDLVRQADALMYEVKNGSKNAVRYANAASTGG